MKDKGTVCSRCGYNNEKAVLRCSRCFEWLQLSCDGKCSRCRQGETPRELKNDKERKIQRCRQGGNSEKFPA